MFITKGHFLSPFTVVIKDNKEVGMLHSVDTDMLVAIRIVGFDENDKTPLIDLVKVDKVFFKTENMPSHLSDLIPNNLRV